MKHRHLNHEAWTPAAIDSCITRGRQEDWNELRRAALDDPKVMENLRKIAGYELNLLSDFDGPCYQEWLQWVQDSKQKEWGPNLKSCGGV